MTLHNPGKIREVLEHMKTSHNFTIINNVKLGQSMCLTLQHDQLDFGTWAERPISLYPPIFLEVASANHQKHSSDLFVLLLNFVEDDQQQVLFSTAFAMLTEETNEASSTIKINLSVKGQKSAEVSKNWGVKCVPDMKWTMKPMGVQKFKEFLNLSVEDRPPFPFTLPVSHILKHYVDSASTFTMQYSFHNVWV